jgi:Skp family chaperone for outer membrane proteins
MKLLKKLNKVFLSLSLAATLSTVEAKMASLDLSTIYENYSLVQEANQVIDDAEVSFKRVLATADIELKELEQKGNDAEIEKKRDEIQDIIDNTVEDLHDQRDLYNTSINRNIQQTIDAIAKEKGYSLILDSSFLLSELEDITSEFLTKLEKNTTSLKTKK